jgi:3-oxoadipate enol-lactonase
MNIGSFHSVNGVSLYCEVSGPKDGVTVVVVSGTGNDLRADIERDGSRPPHPLATAGFRVVQYDQRGLGQSSKPDQPYSMTDYADDAAALIEVLRADGKIAAPVHVVGISFGGMVAQHLAIRHSTLVRRLVLCCTSTGGEGGESFDLLAIADFDDEERVRIMVSVMDTRNDVSTTPPTLAPGYLEMAKRGARARTLMLADPLGAIGSRRQLEARAHHDTFNDLPSVTLPTLVCGGVYDAQASPENVRTLSTRIPMAELKMFDGGHGFLFQDPTSWPFVAEWLARD